MECTINFCSSPFPTAFKSSIVHKPRLQLNGRLPIKKTHSISCSVSNSTWVRTGSLGDMHICRSGPRSSFCYDKPIPEEIIEEPVALLEKSIGDNPRCCSCEAKGAVPCATCSGSGLYVDSIMESQGIIVKVRCLGCGGTGSIMCSHCRDFNLQAAANTFNILQPLNPYPVTFAYLISASKGDLNRLKRTLFALYHPGNYYLLHMDHDAPETEHLDLAKFVSGEPVFAQVGNVWIVGKPNLVTYRGPTMLATTLHAMAMLLRSCKWNLSASDYPLVSQDDLIHAFSNLPRDLNFIQHSARLGWKLNKRGKPIIIDPGLYSLNKSEIWWVIKQRNLPTAFKLYTGSAWTIISRSFAEYSIIGWDNLPRTLLLYYANFVSSPEGYFQTLICNSQDFMNTTVNHDLHYITWDTPPKQHPRSLGLRDYRKTVLSSVPFARKFKKDSPVLDKIDRELLLRHNGKFSFGGWCSQKGVKNEGCSDLSENLGVLKPGPGSRRLKALLTKVLSPRNFKKRQCR